MCTGFRGFMGFIVLVGSWVGTYGVRFLHFSGRGVCVHRVQRVQVWGAFQSRGRLCTRDWLGLQGCWGYIGIVEKKMETTV